MTETVKKAEPDAIVAECWTCAVTMPFKVTEAGMLWHMALDHDVRPVKVTR